MAGKNRQETEDWIQAIQSLLSNRVPDLIPSTPNGDAGDAVDGAGVGVVDHDENIYEDLVNIQGRHLPSLPSAEHPPAEPTATKLRSATFLPSFYRVFTFNALIITLEVSNTLIVDGFTRFLAFFFMRRRSSYLLKETISQ